MAIARLSTGELYGSHKDINAVIGPTEIGAFKLPLDVSEKIAALQMPVDKHGAEYFLSNFDPEAKAFADAEGFSFQQVRCFVPPATKGGPAGFSTNPGGAAGEMPADVLTAYQTPHNVNANEVHFLFQGCITKGLQLEDGHQAVVYITAGEWMRIHSVTMTWPVFNAGEASIAMSCYDREPQVEGGQFEMTMHPQHKILETMKF